MYPLAVTLFPLLWALSHRTGYMPMSACTILGIQMILRRVGDFASTLLDTIVLDSIPGPEYLAMANSATFSMAVSNAPSTASTAGRVQSLPVVVISDAR